MTTIEEHKKTVKELEEDIKEKVRTGILEQRQKIIGFATSEAATNLFALFLHKKKLVSEGTAINHRWFASLKRATEKFPFEFPKKHELVQKLVRQEQLRERLCYGRAKTKKDAEEAVKNFFEIKEIVQDEIGEEI